MKMRDLDVKLTPAEVALLKFLLSIDPGPLGLSASQEKTAQRLLAKLRR